jgi:uncharacterized protein YndB with AHSA1/START domain
MADNEIVEAGARLAAPPAEVYLFWVDPSRYTSWMGRSARLDPVPGGEYFVEMNDGFAAMGSFVAVQPPHRIEFTWGWAPGAGQKVLTGPQADSQLPPGSSRVTVVLLEDDNGGTSLQLQHHELPNEDLRANHRLAWETYLARLATVVAGGDPGPEPHG